MKVKHMFVITGFGEASEEADIRLNEFLSSKSLSVYLDVNQGKKSLTESISKIALSADKFTIISAISFENGKEPGDFLQIKSEIIKASPKAQISYGGSFISSDAFNASLANYLYMAEKDSIPEAVFPSESSGDPYEIERLSMEVIDKLIPKRLKFSEAERNVVKRIVHTSGDPLISNQVYFSEDAVEAGINVLSKGCKIYTDVTMAASGVKKGLLAHFNGEIKCIISDAEVVRKAKEEGTTRAKAAFSLLGKDLDGAIIAIGNAPTALYSLLELVRKDGIKPALVVGMPVGFIQAAASKEALLKSNLPFIAIRGNRGGSNTAAATLNALLIMAKERACART